MDNFVITVSTAGFIVPSLNFRGLDGEAVIRLLRQALPLRTPYPRSRIFAPKSTEHQRRSRKTREVFVAFHNTIAASKHTKIIEQLLGEAARIRHSSDLWDLADVHGIGLVMIPMTAIVSIDADGSVLIDMTREGGAAVLSTSVFQTATPERATWWSEMIMPRESHVTLRLAEDVFVQIPIDDEHEGALMRLLAGATIGVRGVRGFEHVPGLEANPILREHLMELLARA